MPHRALRPGRGLVQNGPETPQHRTLPMASDQPLPPLDDAAIDAVARLVHAALLNIQQHEDDPQAFLAWMRAYAPRLAPALFQGGDLDRQAAAYWMGVGLWNVTPLARQGYRPQPLPAPPRNQPCPCGSDRNYEHCCEGTTGSLELPTEAIWTALLQTRPDKHWLDEAGRGALPVEGRLAAAFHFHQADRARSLIKLLDPELAQGGANVDPRLAPAIDLLCDAYDATYRTDRKKRDLLTGLSRHPARSIRAEANQRLAAWLEDQGELDGAWQALEDAMRAEPDNPGAAILEITLRCARGEKALAAQRADFWYRRLQPLADDLPELLGLLDRARTDPCGLYDDFGREGGDPDLARLIAWLASVAPRGLPAYTWEPLQADPADPYMQHAHRLCPSRAVTKTERAWRRVAPLAKPFATQWLPHDATCGWDLPDGWLAFLQAHPDAFDSLDILDDLVSLVLGHAESSLPWVVNQAQRPLLGRAIAILEAAQATAAPEATLPWLFEPNRPGLRLLARTLSLSDQDWGSASQLQRLGWYLQLNPRDNHGWRAVLVNELLQAGQDVAALALIARYADDSFPELRYGEALALHRLGDRGRAVTALAKARALLPLVFDYLVRERVRRPALRDDSYSFGGKDQAWLYREAMRDTWLGTSGMPELLRSLQRKRR